MSVAFQEREAHGLLTKTEVMFTHSGNQVKS